MVTCQTNETIIIWEAFVPLLSDWLRRLIVAVEPDGIEVAVVGGIPFQLFKISTSPLVSNLIVNSSHVTIDLNGTVINCTKGREEVISTTILIIGNSMLSSSI